MKKYLLAALLAGAGLAALEEVVDGRPDNLPLGLVYRGLADKSAAVAFQNGLAYELTQFAWVQLLPAAGVTERRPAAGRAPAAHVSGALGETRAGLIRPGRRGIYMPASKKLVSDVGSSPDKPPG